MGAELLIDLLETSESIFHRKIARMQMEVHAKLEKFLCELRLGTRQFIHEHPEYSKSEVREMAQDAFDNECKRQRKIFIQAYNIERMILFKRNRAIQSFCSSDNQSTGT